MRWRATVLPGVRKMCIMGNKEATEEDEVSNIAT
jgi:hypothetical protein